jgi:DeoR family transcriptional regulator, glycerol-3-phosphate regulon repressor
MKPKDRRAEIVTRVAREQQLGVEDLAHHFGVSVETVRRDLSILAEEGAILKVHGGVRARGRLRVEGSFQERMAEEPVAKAAIAEKLVPEIGSGDTIMIDTGSTTLVAAEALAATPGLSVVTNSVLIADVFGRRAAARTKVFLLGGDYEVANRQTVGPDAIAQLDLYRADHAILTVAALSPETGATDADVAEARIARAMIARAGNVIVLATASKLGRRAGFRVCGLDEIDMLVTEVPPEGAMAEALSAAGVTVK